MSPYSTPGSLRTPRLIPGARPTDHPSSGSSGSSAAYGATSDLDAPAVAASHDAASDLATPTVAVAPDTASDLVTPTVVVSHDATMAIGTAVVIGLGLIGGSVARDLAACGVRVLGYDRDRDTVVAAMHAGILAGALDDDLRGVETADVVILATPVDQSPPLLAALAARSTSARLITDVGSTKRSIVDAATTLGLASRFVGAHPLAGDHRWGWAASRCHLFQGARVYLCPTDNAEASTVEFAHSFWQLLGAVPVLLDAPSHDALLACSSHLPQLAATALALTLVERGVERAQLGSGGLDMTRLAGSSPELWTAITRDNAAELDDALATLIEQLGEMRSALRNDDGARLHARFQAGWEWFAEMDAAPPG